LFFRTWLYPADSRPFNGHATLGLELAFAFVTAEVVYFAVLLQSHGLAFVYLHPAYLVFDFL
jgi:hypothetical protein